MLNEATGPNTVDEHEPAVQTVIPACQPAVPAARLHRGGGGIRRGPRPQDRSQISSPRHTATVPEGDASGQDREERDHAASSQAGQPRRVHREAPCRGRREQGDRGGALPTPATSAYPQAHPQYEQQRMPRTPRARHRARPGGHISLVLPWARCRCRRGPSRGPSQGQADAAAGNSSPGRSPSGTSADTASYAVAGSAICAASCKSCPGY